MIRYSYKEDRVVMSSTRETSLSITSVSCFNTSVTQKWNTLKYFISEDTSSHVFCHGGCFVDYLETFYIFGGYNGLTRLNDFKYFNLNGNKNINI